MLERIIDQRLGRLGCVSLALVGWEDRVEQAKPGRGQA